LVIGCGSSAKPGQSLIAAGGSGPDGAGGSGLAAGGSAGELLSNGNFGPDFESSMGGDGPSEPAIVEQNLIALRIEPADQLLKVQLGQAATLDYHAYGRFASDPDSEVELTERTVFYVPDNYLVAGFPSDGAHTLSTRLPSGASDAQQRGGTLTVRAQASNSDGSVTTVTTTLTVELDGELLPPAASPLATPALPADPAAQFLGTASAARAPLLAYPNDGVLLPPNLGRLELHFQPGAPENTLFEIELESATSDLKYFTRCYADSAEFVPGACALILSGSDFDHLAASNQGSGPVRLTVRGSDEQGTFGESDSIDIEFAAQRIDGAVYYWTTSNETSIERFDFGSGQSAPETFVKAESTVAGNSCVGCHALSRQGDKIFYSLGNSDDGELMYVSDLSKSPSDPDFYTYDGATLDFPLTTIAAKHNRVLTGSFNPDGSQFVAVAPVNDPAADQTLFFHDGTTGERNGSLALPFIPTQPDWSPDGERIALTAIERNRATISFLGGAIDVIGRSNGVWDAATLTTVVPSAVNKNRFNPTFFPDGSVLLYSEVDQATYTDLEANSCNESTVRMDGHCDGYSDPGAKTWAVAPEAGASAVRLDNAARPGVADQLYPPPQTNAGPGDLMDTYPKPAPFLISHRGKTLGWFTVGSQRRAGLRKFYPHASVVGDDATQSLLWMFALDAAAVKNGQDGSYPGFFLPFQDLTTSNHMAQWTQRIVSDAPPPPAPPPPAAPPPPPPPPPPTILR
jgi:hypothetical protein